MRVLAFGFPHFVRVREQARLLRLGVDFVPDFRRPTDRWGRFRALFPLRREATHKIGREVYPDRGERTAWATAEHIWGRVEKADAILVWNGSRGHGLMAVRAAQSLGKPIVYIENGFLPDTVQVDLEGINHASSLARLDPRSLPVASGQAIDFRQRPLGRDTGHVAETHLPDDLPEGFVLFAAQVHDDSQITRFSPDWTSVDDAIRYVAGECAAAGLSLVVKEHPQDHGRIDRAPLKAELPGVRFLENADNAALISACRAFVTINSSLALQAVSAEKPVFTLGDAAYNLPGIALRIRPPALLREAFSDATFDQDLRRRYLAYLRNVALVPFQTRLATDEQLRGVAARVAELLKGTRSV